CGRAAGCGPGDGSCARLGCRRAIPHHGGVLGSTPLTAGLSGPRPADFERSRPHVWRLLMVRLQHQLVLLGVALGACRAPVREPPPAEVNTPPTPVAIGQAALAALAAAPWDSDPTGWGSLCSSDAPC